MFLPMMYILLCSDVLSESQFNVEMVVQCVRLSSNPQTHHHALIFLSTAAGIFPVSCFTL